MKYAASVTDFFRSPKWVPNLLLSGLCAFIPMVGPIVLTGWHSAAMMGRRNAYDFENYPAFNFNDFGKNLERGVWPFLVNLIGSFVMVPVMWVMIALPMMIGIAFLGPLTQQGEKDPPVWLMVGLSVVVIAFYLLAMMVFLLITKPLLIRAALTQDLAKAFSWKFFKDFTARTWRQQVTSTLFLMVAGMGMMIAGVACLCVGLYAAISLMMFTIWHLDRQLYDLYLERGGEPVPVSPKISDQPPPLAVT